MTRQLAFVALSLIALTPALAADPPERRVSFSLGTGIGSDLGNLGETIVLDGTLDTADGTIANYAYATGQVLMSDQDNKTIWHNSDHTDSPFHLLGEAPQEGGSLLGAELNASMQVELDDVINAPIFLRLGFAYMTKVSGGTQSRTFGNAAVDSPDLSALLVTNGEDPANYVGGTMATDWGASWVEIPITLGLRVPLGGYSAVYGGAGASLFSGGLSLDLNIDQAYANVLATHIDFDALSVQNYSVGPIDDEITFRSSGVGLNYSIGAQAEVSKGAAVFLDLNGSGMETIVFSSPLNTATRRMLTGTSSQALADADPEWFKRMAFPLVMRGASVRLGLRVYVF
jgi:hypothetical protein